MKLNEIIYYFLHNYPYSDELSKTRITKMVYLADWYSAVNYGKQITDIEWYFDHYGPYVIDVYDAAKDDKNIVIENSFSQFGSPKEIIRLNNNSNGSFTLTTDEKVTLDKVINDTRYMYWNDFIKYVYDTYPIKSQQRYSTLNLVNLAEESKFNKN
ncbi:Panacea domain-containing protein [Virgibacillus salexigens]|uniref:Panacea domain-containing protein n=1 Tax=Virgibacillus salexigens TaxID=61016 RepID=UPI003081A3E3